MMSIQNYFLKIILLIILSLIYKCSNSLRDDSLRDTPIDELVGNVDLEFLSRVVSFSNCSEVESFYKNELIKELRLDAYFDIYYYRLYDHLEGDCNRRQPT